MCVELDFRLWLCEWRVSSEGVDKGLRADWRTTKKNGCYYYSKTPYLGRPEVDVQLWLGLPVRVSHGAMRFGQGSSGVQLSIVDVGEKIILRQS